MVHRQKSGETWLAESLFIIIILFLNMIIGDIVTPAVNPLVLTTNMLGSSVNSGKIYPSTSNSVYDSTRILPAGSESDPYFDINVQDTTVFNTI
ncbi:hypothetical protein BJX61DRAFT_526465 [Aspergillus egyptiacus]|nr:hypothetical protein BJX61DRAFT_526465 [Aspergillus egyptiacus]